MLPSYRYHVTTLAAVFLALGVGLLIGSSFVQPAVVQRQTRQLEGLRAQFNRDVVALRDENRRYADFVARLSPSLIDSKLTGRRVALVQTGDYADALQKIRDMLEQAGATVPSVTVVDRLFPARTQTVLADLQAKLRPGHPDMPAGATAPAFVIATALARGNGNGDMAALQDAKLVQTEGDYGQPADHVVLVGGASADFESRADAVDVPLIGQLKTLGAKVVFAEPTDAGISYIASVRSADVATVDNADTDLGRISLALALFGPVGDYGAKHTARSGIAPAPAP